MLDNTINFDTLNQEQQENCLKHIIKRLKKEDPFYIPEIYSKHKTSQRKNNEAFLMSRVNQICVISNNWDPYHLKKTSFDIMDNISLRFDIEDYKDEAYGEEWPYPPIGIINSEFLMNAVKFFHHLYLFDFRTSQLPCYYLRPPYPSWYNAYVYYSFNKDALLKYFNINSVKLALWYFIILHYIDIYRNADLSQGYFHRGNYAPHLIHQNDFNYKYHQKVMVEHEHYIHWTESDNDEDEYLLIREEPSSWQLFGHYHIEHQTNEIYLNTIRLFYRFAYFYDEYKLYLSTIRKNQETSNHIKELDFDKS